MMSDPETVTSTVVLKKEMKDQIAALIAMVEELQHNQTWNSSLTVQEEEEENAMGPGNLVALMEFIQAFLKASLSTTLANADCTKRVDHIGVLDCDSIWCPKLDPVILAVMPNEATKADSYMLCFQQDVTAPLMAIIDTSQEGRLTTEMAVWLHKHLMDNAHQHTTQERHKQNQMNINPALIG